MNSPKCPICRQYVENVFRTFTRAGERVVVEKIRVAHPHWSPSLGMCERCLYLNEFDTVNGEHFAPDPGLSIESSGASVKSTLFRARVKNEFALLPTHLRLNADPRFRGEGITIAFIDSGFFPHPDLMKPKRRIRRIVDVTDEQFPRSYFSSPHGESWHGMMTSVAAAGNGHLSRGVYRGIASSADVVLIKVMDTRTHRINTQNITRGIRWAIDHAEEYHIRIISLSVADDEPSTFRDSPVDQAVEEAVKHGIVVVAAVGNNPTKPIVPPASSPSTITVGGLDDQNEMWKNLRRMFHSTYGRTVDGFEKPELIAPAIWVAGPILPRDVQFRESALLFTLLRASQRKAARILAAYRELMPNTSSHIATGDYRERARSRINEMKYISKYYKHVDGTSFAAPIVSSVIAQMLEANPFLTPHDVKTILMETAEPLLAVPSEQQGRGVLAPRAAVAKALRKRHDAFAAGVHAVQDRLLFAYQNRVPHTVAVAGSFNDWDHNAALLHESQNGWWSIWVPKPTSGRHQYKYVIDGAVWLEDPSNAQRTPDGMGGWNSIVDVH